MIIFNKLKSDGLSQTWLMKRLAKRGYKISRPSLCLIAHAKSLPKKKRMLVEICDILQIDLEECVKAYKAVRTEKIRPVDAGADQVNITDNTADNNSEQRTEMPQ